MNLPPISRPLRSDDDLRAMRERLDRYIADMARMAATPMWFIPDHPDLIVAAPTSDPDGTVVHTITTL